MNDKMQNGSGRKERVMISCVTFETTKVTEPIKFYDCTRAHIIHYIKDVNNPDNVFREFYDRTCEIIEEDSNGKVKIIEHNNRVSDFTEMLSTILNIIEKEQKENECDIYINISAGSSEYSAAAAIGAMMSDNVLPFSVNTAKYTVETERIRDIYYENGKPVGLTKTTYRPRSMPRYSIDKPPEHLVRGLRMLHELNETKKRSKSSSIVPELKEKGIWFRDEPEGNVKQSDAVNYHRDYVSKWMERGWVEKNELTKRIVLTDEGKAIIETFYLD